MKTTKPPRKTEMQEYPAFVSMSATFTAGLVSDTIQLTPLVDDNAALINQLDALSDSPGVIANSMAEVEAHLAKLKHR